MGLGLQEQLIWSKFALRYAADQKSSQMKLNFILIIACSAIAFMTGANAQTPQDFDALAKQLAREALSLRSDSNAEMAQLLELKAENALPAPELEGSYLWGEGATGDKWSISISQSMDWPGVYSARSRAIKAEKKALELGQRERLLSKVLEVKLALIDIVAAHKNLETSTMLLDTVASLYKATKKAVEAGEITILSLNKIDIEKMSAEKRLNEDAAALSSAVSALGSIIGREIQPGSSLPQDYPEEPLLPLEKYTELLRDYSPELEAMRQRVLSAEAMAKVASRQSLPGITIGYTYENEGVERWHGVSVGISLPFLSNKNKRRASAAAANSAKISAEMLAVEQRAVLQADYVSAQKADALCNRYTEIFERQDNIRLLKKAFDNEQINLLDYLAELNYFINARRDYIEAQYQRAYFTARLNRLKAAE